MQPLMTAAEVAEVVRVDERTLQRKRSAGQFPQPDVRIGRRILWRPETIRAWVESGGRVH